MLNLAIRWFFVVLLLIMTGCDNGNMVDKGITVKKSYTEVEKTERAIKSVLIDKKGYTEAENIARAVKRLDAASHWMIEKGIMEIFTNSAYVDKFRRVLIDEFSSTLGTTSKPKNEDELIRFIIKNYSIHYDINLLKRSPYNGSIYEYWVIFMTSPYQEYHDDCRYLITRSDSIKSRRTILKESGQFFHQYTEGNAVAISLDYENDMYIRYMLSAWNLPHCYKNYPHLPQKEVRATSRIDRTGKGSFEFVQ